ncbi:MAG: hypothetical protein ABI587_15035 [Gemmatimonadales bacterium]
MTIVHQLAVAVAPWADFYNNSAVAQSTVAFGHFGGMMTAGGLALSADRSTLRALRGESWEHRRHLKELSSIHPLVVGALAITAASGLLMFAADLEALSGSPMFWIKMGLVGLLLINGGMMVRAEHRLEQGHPSEGRLWQQLRRASVLSLALWFAVVLAGAVLPNVV